MHTKRIIIVLQKRDRSKNNVNDMKNYIFTHQHMKLKKNEC